MKPLIQILVYLIIAAPVIANVKPSQIKIPKETMQEIKIRAAQEWPDNYSMQAYEIDRQVESYKLLYAWARTNSDNELAEKLFRNAQREWPDNYAMQWYEVKREIRALERIYGDD